MGSVELCVEVQGLVFFGPSGVIGEEEVGSRLISVWDIAPLFQLAIENGWDWKGFVLSIGK